MQQGDTAALDELVHRYLRPVHAVVACFLAGRADVDDAVQDTFMRALRNIGSYDPTRPFAPWLFEVARNVARRSIDSSARRGAEQVSIDFADPADSPDTHAERNEMIRAIDNAIAMLPEQQRVVFRLHDVEGYTTGEISGIMGLTTGTVRSHLHYARHTLRSCLTHVQEPPTRR